MTQKQQRLEAYKQGSYHGLKLTIAAYIVSIVIALSMFSCSPKFQNNETKKALDYVQIQEKAKDQKESDKWFVRSLVAGLVLMQITRKK
jgi:uncharacterized membrane protein